MPFLSLKTSMMTSLRGVGFIAISVKSVFLSLYLIEKMMVSLNALTVGGYIEMIN